MSRAYRNAWLVLIAFELLASSFSPPARAAESPATDGVQVADLREQLKDGLRARLPAEFEFVDHVVALVDDGTLPLELVKSTFAWARKKYHYPFPYFERGLRLRAARQGIQI